MGLQITGPGSAASAAQGALADTALQPDGDGSALTDIGEAQITPDGTVFASAAQGATADTALQPDATADGTYTFGGGATGDIATMTFTNGLLTAVTLVP